MSDTIRRYARPQSTALIYCGVAHSQFPLIRDEASWEEFDEDAIDAYIDEGYEMVTLALAKVCEPSTPYSSFRAKELRFMLEALIEVKEMFTSEQPVLLDDDH